jgi:hypothetical protein
MSSTVNFFIVNLKGKKSLQIKLKMNFLSIKNKNWNLLKAKSIKRNRMSSFFEIEADICHRQFDVQKNH